MSKIPLQGNVKGPSQDATTFAPLGEDQIIPLIVKENMKAVKTLVVEYLATKTEPSQPRKLQEIVSSACLILRVESCRSNICFTNQYLATRPSRRK